jgi:RNA polymerase sigma factor (sigma-70 family)
MTENRDLQTLLEACSTDISGHFRPVYEHLIDRVYAYVRYRVHTETTAQDLTQDVFIDLYESLPSFTYQSDAQFYSFVFTITKRKLAKHYGKQAVEHAQVAEVDEFLLPSPTADTETTDAVLRALATLEPDTREIITLHHWSRYTFPEIASLLHMTESAVRVRHHRALKTLATILSN